MHAMIHFMSMKSARNCSNSVFSTVHLTQRFSHEHFNLSLTQAFIYLCTKNALDHTAHRSPPQYNHCAI